MRIHTHYLAIALCSFSLASPASAQLTLPSNLHVTPIYLDLVESMAAQSQTFRQQLVRIGDEPGVFITLDVVPHIIGARAATRIVRQVDGLTAQIEVSRFNEMARFNDLVELIAHEIEHVIEQIDGVDLAAGAGRPDTGISAVNAAGTAFETSRAARAGVIVAQEVRDAARSAAR